MDRGQLLQSPYSFCYVSQAQVLVPGLQSNPGLGQNGPLTQLQDKARLKKVAGCRLGLQSDPGLDSDREYEISQELEKTTKYSGIWAKSYRGLT